jgi:hypothetical protein
LPGQDCRRYDADSIAKLKLRQPAQSHQLDILHCCHTVRTDELVDPGAAVVATQEPDDEDSRVPSPNAQLIAGLANTASKAARATMSTGVTTHAPARVCLRRRAARFGPHLVSAGDIVFADDDGVLFVAAERAEQVLVTAHQIWQTERTRPAGSGRVRHCASRPPSMTTWPAAPLTRHTPSGGICAASAGPSKNKISQAPGLTPLRACHRQLTAPDHRRPDPPTAIFRQPAMWHTVRADARPDVQPPSSHPAAGRQDHRTPPS